MKIFLKEIGINTIKHQYGIQAHHDVAWIRLIHFKIIKRMFKVLAYSYIT